MFPCCAQFRRHSVHHQPYRAHTLSLRNEFCPQIGGLLIEKKQHQQYPNRERYREHDFQQRKGVSLRSPRREEGERCGAREIPSPHVGNYAPEMLAEEVHGSSSFISGKRITCASRWVIGGSS